MLRLLPGNILAKVVAGCPLQQGYGEVFRTQTGYLRIRLRQRDWGWDAAELREVQRWLEENDDITLFWSSHE